MDLFLRFPSVAPRSSRASSHTPSCPCCRRRFADLRRPRSRDWGSLGFRSDFAQPEQDRTLVRGSGDLSFHPASFSRESSEMDVAGVLALRRSFLTATWTSGDVVTRANPDAHFVCAGVGACGNCLVLTRASLRQQHGLGG